MRERMVKGVVFDLGRVLINYDVMRTCSNLCAFSPLSPDQMRQAIFMGEGLKKFRIPYETGEVTCEDFFEHLQGHLQLRNIEFEDFQKHWPDIIGPPEGMYELLSWLRPGLPRGILSNIDPLNWGVASSLSLVQDHFRPEHCVLSWREKRRKPEQAIYLLTAERLRIEPRAGLYIDDRQENVEAARLAGFFAEQYNCLEQPVEELEKILDSYGVLH